MIRIVLEELATLDTGRKALRSFGLVVGGVLVGIAAVVLWRQGWAPGTAVRVLSGIGGALLLLGLAAPAVLRPLYRVWMGLALVLGFVMTRVLLTLVFVFAVIPTGLLLRLFGKDPLDRRWQPDAPSYWIPKTYMDETPQRLERYY